MSMATCANEWIYKSSKIGLSNQLYGAAKKKQKDTRNHDPKIGQICGISLFNVFQLCS
jgi:hypothetical protein